MSPLQRFRDKVRLGARVMLVAYAVNSRPAYHRHLNVVRVVDFVGSTSFALRVDGHQNPSSFIDWPLSSELTWLTDTVVTITYVGITPLTSMTYDFDPPTSSPDML